MQALEQITWPVAAGVALVAVLAVVGALGLMKVLVPRLLQVLDRIIIFACGCYTLYVAVPAPEPILAAIGGLLILMSVLPLVMMLVRKKPAVPVVKPGSDAMRPGAAPAAPRPPGG